MLTLQDRLWGELDFAALAGLWDADEPQPFYIGDEYSAPVVGWHDLGRHFGRLGGRLRKATVRSSLLLANRVADDLAVAVYHFDWSFATVESRDLLSGQRWVTALLRNRVVGWRLVQLVESAAYDVDLV